MAQSSVRRDLFAPPFAKTFAASTPAVLHSTDAPANAQHLPCAVLIGVGAAAGQFVFVDANGVTNTVELGDIVDPLYLPIAPAELTEANDFPVTVFWNPAP